MFVQSNPLGYGNMAIVNYIKTRGKGYSVSEGDGVFYSYSVYDSNPLLSRWGDSVIYITTNRNGNSRLLEPLITASHLLVGVIKRTTDE